MQIRNVNQLRDFVSEQLIKLCEGEIKPELANACAMLSANMLLSVKLEMEYSKMQHEKPRINFMECNNKKLIDATPEKAKPKK